MQHARLQHHVQPALCGRIPFFGATADCYLVTTGNGVMHNVNPSECPVG